MFYGYGTIILLYDNIDIVMLSIINHFVLAVDVKSKIILVIRKKIDWNCGALSEKRVVVDVVQVKCQYWGQ